MNKKLHELNDDEFVERLLQAGRAEAPREEAVTNTLRALGLHAPSAAASGSLVWKLVGGSVLTAAAGLAVWGLWPRDAANKAPPTPATQSAIQPTIAVKTLEAGAEPPLQEPSAVAPAPSAAVHATAGPSAAVHPTVGPRAPATAPASSVGKARGDRLMAEVQALDEVRAAIGRGSAGQALVLLDAFDREFPGAVMGGEARVLRIEALAKSGNQAGARRLGEQYLREMPNGPHSGRVRVLIGQ